MTALDNTDVDLVRTVEVSGAHDGTPFGTAATVTIADDDGVTTLGALELAYADGGAVALSPAFASATTAYEATVMYPAGVVTIEAAPTDGQRHGRVPSGPTAASSPTRTGSRPAARWRSRWARTPSRCGSPPRTPREARPTR